jgi:hypothetical protein
MYYWLLIGLIVWIVGTIIASICKNKSWFGFGKMDFIMCLLSFFGIIVGLIIIAISSIIISTNFCLTHL